MDLTQRNSSSTFAYGKAILKNNSFGIIAALMDLDLFKS